MARALCDLNEEKAVRWVVVDILARARRPGYGEGAPVAESVVEAWCDEARELGIRSILCLLADEQLRFYEGLRGGGLLETYKARGFKVGHVPVVDYKNPPLNGDELARVWKVFQKLPRPVLIHCSAGVVRTGAAVGYIEPRLAALGKSEPRRRRGGG